MPQTDRLKLPLISANQSQKEVTHNAALELLDILVHPIVQDIGVNTPPASPILGDCYIVGPTPTGLFTGYSNAIAKAVTGGWRFYTPFKSLSLWVESREMRYVFTGTQWQPEGMFWHSNGSYLRVEELTETKTLTGSTATSAIQIPDKALVIAVNLRVTQAITGVSSFGIGVVGDPLRYGNGIGTSLDTTNIGMSYNPITYYSPTPLVITPASGSFTAGKVSLQVLYLKPRGPWNF